VNNERMARSATDSVEKTFVDAEGVTIHYHVWTPRAPRAAILLVHGIGEYAKRYELLAQELVAGGYAVYGIDYRGHGATGAEQYAGDLTKLGRPGRGGIRAAIRGIHTLRGLIAEAHPGVPIVLFGHSMGAIIGYEVALRMTDAGLPAPVHLFASGRRAPSRYRDDDFRGVSDDRLVAELRKLGGSDAAMLADPELLAMVLPAIRSDYRAVETYRHEPGRRLDCPVTVFTGDRDPRVSVEEARAWEEHTTGPADLRVLPGGHFFLVDQAAPIIATVTEKLAGPALTGSTGRTS